ncbi:MAG: hypothetical protein IT373_17755, partial [Polyangiaceae bacterium]|nr:hypothetical protein [Polyangiaceae bacterium]
MGRKKGRRKGSGAAPARGKDAAPRTKRSDPKAVADHPPAAEPPASRGISLPAVPPVATRAPRGRHAPGAASVEVRVSEADASLVTV